MLALSRAPTAPVLQPAGAPGRDRRARPGLYRRLAAPAAWYLPALERARELGPTIAATAKATLWSADDDDQQLFDFGSAPPNAVTLYSQGVNQSAPGAPTRSAPSQLPSPPAAESARPAPGPFR